MIVTDDVLAGLIIANIGSTWTVHLALAKVKSRIATIERVCAERHKIDNQLIVVAE
jgi:hypothetical protein